MLDDELISAPSIDYVAYPDGIDGRPGAEITGSFTIDSAQDLAKILEIGALPVRLELVSRSQVSASLGQQALDQGLLAAAAGFAIVVLFLLVFYRVLGVIASVAMGIYGLYLYAIVELIPIVLTLPGIAGMILTLGVAADANIVIFEHVKEEIRAGRSVGAAIAAGYRKGLTAILDANIVTILVAFILFVLATSGVRGFALTLGVGVIVSLFTAVLATQAILYALRGTRLVRSRAALGARDAKPIRFDFIGGSRWFFSMSGVILLICALAIAIQGLNFGIDFEGGTRIAAPLERAATVEQVRDTLAPLGLGEAEIQTVDNRELGRNVVQINAEELTGDEIDRVEDALRDGFGFADDPSTQSIGASFGETVAENTIRAIIASLIIVSIYITLRFQWKYAVPVLIALSHDLLITSGVYALTGREVTASTAAALLTILGFSLYDTIVVFDRVRENIPRMPNAAFSQIYNRSMSEVIVRSLATSFCAALPILALLLFGGETQQDFAFALLVGTGLRHLLVGVHRRPRAHPLEGARARVQDARGAHPGRVRHGARLRRGRRRAAQSTSPPPSANAAAIGSPPPPTHPAAPPAKNSTTWSATSASSKTTNPSGRPPAAAPAAARARGPATSRKSSGATAATGGRADGRPRVGHDRHRPLALRHLRPRPLLVRHRRRLPRSRARRPPVRIPRARPHRARPKRHRPDQRHRGDPGRHRRNGRRVRDRPPGGTGRGAAEPVTRRARTPIGAACPRLLHSSSLATT